MNKITKDMVQKNILKLYLLKRRKNNLMRIQEKVQMVLNFQDEIIKGSWRNNSCNK